MGIADGFDIPETDSGMEIAAVEGLEDIRIQRIFYRMLTYV